MGQQMATGETKQTAMAVPLASAKAVIDDAKTAKGAVVSSIGAGLGAGSAAVTQATTAITPAASIPFFESLVPWITGAGVALVIAGGIYAAYVGNRQKQLDDALLNLKAA